MVPTPTSDVSHILPPSNSTKSFDIARPSPVPSNSLRALEFACTNRSKITSRLASGIPIPVSLTYMVILEIKELHEDTIAIYIKLGRYEYNYILTILSNKIKIDDNIIEFNTFDDFKNKINKELSNSIRKIRYGIKED